jgi:mono/diheme cytochrome c family protein/cytochrome bd-type quinol oxidase subunit 1
MQYPFWDLPIGYGILMAAIAIVHVFISHFAIGGGLFLILNERAARRSNDEDRLDFLEQLSKFFILVTLVAGALTGVGIWFVIGLLNPAAVGVLIRNFVWGWATEWTFFLVEILAAILYFYGWRRLSPARHMILGWIYFGAAWLSLFIINGILTFMLTPGRWLTTGNFWDGFFNPTFWPSLVLRTFIAATLAGLYALAVASRRSSGALRDRLVRHASLWSLCGLAGAVPSLYWYWKAIPSAITAQAMQSMPMPISALRYSYWLAAVIGMLLLLFGLLAPRLQRFSLALATMAVGLAWFGAFEWFRESIRKPYIIAGYMYANGVEVGLRDTYQRLGYLSQIAYRSGSAGADLFHHACGSCHTLHGYKPLDAAFQGTDRAFVSATVKATDQLRGNMPPFLGRAGEADLIAEFIESRIDQRSLSSIYGLQGAELGKQVFDVRCGRCHAPGTPRDNKQSLAGLAQADYENILDDAAGLGEGMPAFTGDQTERRALIQYFKTLGVGGQK